MILPLIGLLYALDALNGAITGFIAKLALFALTAWLPTTKLLTAPSVLHFLCYLGLNQLTLLWPFQPDLLHLPNHPTVQNESPD